MINIIERNLNDHFTKYDVEGLPRLISIHHFTGADDPSASPHDHPVKFVSHILLGGYVEEVFHVKDDGSWTSEIIERLPSTVHEIEPTHIHRIIRLLDDECITVVIPGPIVREWRFWDFSTNIAQSRPFHEGEFN